MSCWYILAGGALWGPFINSLADLGPAVCLENSTTKLEITPEIVSANFQFLFV